MCASSLLLLLRNCCSPKTVVPPFQPKAMAVLDCLGTASTSVISSRASLPLFLSLALRLPEHSKPASVSPAYRHESPWPSLTLSAPPRDVTAPQTSLQALNTRTCHSPSHTSSIRASWLPVEGADSGGLVVASTDLFLRRAQLHHYPPAPLRPPHRDEEVEGHVRTWRRELLPL